MNYFRVLFLLLTVGMISCCPKPLSNSVRIGVPTSQTSADHTPVDSDVLGLNALEPKDDSDDDDYVHINKFGDRYKDKDGLWRYNIKRNEKYDRYNRINKFAMEAAQAYLKKTDPQCEHEIKQLASHYRLVVIYFRTLPPPGHFIFGGAGELYYDAKYNRIVARTDYGH